MMRSLVRWGTTLGLTSSIVLASWLGATLRVLALPLEEVVAILRPVPVFAIADAQGTPLVLTKPGQPGVSEVYISKKIAEQVVEQLKKQKPDIGAQARVVPISLGKVYELAEISAQQENGVKFSFIPTQEQFRAAQTLWRQQRQPNQPENFPGTPLFVARAGAAQGYLTLKQGEREVIPFFFDRQQLDNIVTRFKTQNPAEANTVKVEVVSLEVMLRVLREQNNAQFKTLLLVPSREATAFLNSLPRRQ